MTYFPSSLGLFQGVLRNIVSNGLTDHIKLSSYPVKSDVKRILDFDNITLKPWISIDVDGNGQYVLIELTDRFVALTGFALRSQSYSHPRTWDFDVSADGNNWTNAHSAVNNDALLTKYGKIFRTKPVVGRFFRFTNKGPSANSIYPNRLRISAIDLYGTIIPCNDNCSTTPSFIKIPEFHRTCRRSIYNKINLINMMIIIIKK